MNIFARKKIPDRVAHVVCSDDILLQLPSLGALEETLLIFNNISKRPGLIISVNKIKSVSCCSKREVRNLTLNEQLEWVKKDKYLGINVNIKHKLYQINGLCGQFNVKLEASLKK